LRAAASPRSRPRYEWIKTGGASFDYEWIKTYFGLSDEEAPSMHDIYFWAKVRLEQRGYDFSNPQKRSKNLGNKIFFLVVEYTSM